MSRFYFITADKELPQIDYTKCKTLTLREAKEQGLINEKSLKDCIIKNGDATITCYENEEDFHALQIHTYNRSLEGIGYHTDKIYIYEIVLSKSEKNLNNLLEYLKNNLQIGESLELWSVWLGHGSSKMVTSKKIQLKYLKIEDLKKWAHKDDYCLYIIN